MSDTLTMRITGMTCAGCAGRAERALAAASGVERATVFVVGNALRLRGLSAPVTEDRP